MSHLLAMAVASFQITCKQQCKVTIFAYIILRRVMGLDKHEDQETSRYQCERLTRLAPGGAFVRTPSL